MPLTEQYQTVSGTSTDAYDFSNAVDSFLVDSLGWLRIHTLTSGVSNIDRVYSNDGGETGNTYNTIYYRLEAISGTVFNHVYSFYTPGGGASSGHMTGYENTSNFATSSGGITFRLIGNKNVLWYILENIYEPPGGIYSSHVGYCDSYYTDVVDDYPVCLIGHQDPSDDFTSARVMMYGPDGTAQYYYAENYANLVKYGVAQARTGACFGASVALMNSDALQAELRGELRGIKQAYGSTFSSWDLVTTSGTTISGSFYVVKHANSDSNTFLYGPFEEEA